MSLSLVSEIWHCLTAAIADTQQRHLTAGSVPIVEPTKEVKEPSPAAPVPDIPNGGYFVQTPHLSKAGVQEHHKWHWIPSFSILRPADKTKSIYLGGGVAQDFLGYQGYDWGWVGDHGGLTKSAGLTYCGKPVIFLPDDADYPSSEVIARLIHERAGTHRDFISRPCCFCLAAYQKYVAYKLTV